MSLATVALQVLLDDPRLDLDAVDWAELTRLAERRRVVVRLADAVARRIRKEELPAGLATSAGRAATRTQRTLALIDGLGDACTRLGVTHAFLKTAENYPDSGPDIDLLIADPSAEIDRAILEGIPGARRGHGFRQRLSGSRTYTAAMGIVIDLHHARLGRFGEQARYARILLSRARPVPLGVTSCYAPSAEDHFLLIATQQAYTRPALRISDVYGAIGLLRRCDQLNWDYIFATALSIDMLPTLGAYLDYLDRMHMRLLNQSLLPQELLARFTTGEPVLPAAGSDTRFPATAVARRLYVNHVHAALEAGRWHSMARLLLLPVVAAFAARPRRSS
jgi:hypothetical protein